MASKASKLQMGAKKTGMGLFADMSPLALTNQGNNSLLPKETIPTVEKEEKHEPVKEVVKEPEIKAPEVPAESVKPVIEEKPEEPEKVTSKINKSEKPVSKAKDKPASRYEKDKFLLLDIRGYRDYVEHMAKAANTSATKYIRSLIEQDMEQNMDIYEAHKELERRLMNRAKRS